MLIERIGNLFDYEHQAYAHGVNNQGVMEAGIAVEFKRRYPGMYEQYRDLCINQELKPGDAFLYHEQGKPSVFNLVTQSNVFFAEKQFLVKSIRAMYVKARDEDITDIAMPTISCGLGGLVLADLKIALHPFIQDTSHHVTIWHLPNPKKHYKM
jgi:O-acetyl-ADP-ribose deacetylase (regulator of RNase III)